MILTPISPTIMKTNLLSCLLSQNNKPCPKQQIPAGPAKKLDFLNRSPFFLIILLVALAFGKQGYSQTNTWDGSSSVNWNTPANWSLNLVPTTAHDVVVPDGGVRPNITVNTGAVCKSLTMNGGGNPNTITIAAGQSLSVTLAVIINAGTGGSDHKIISVGTSTMSCASITMAATTGDNRTCEVNLTTGIVNVSGDITMNGTNLRNYFRFTGAGTLNLGGNFITPLDGSLIPATGTVNCNGANPQLIQGVNTTSFYNLTINKTLAANTVTSATTANAFSVSNNLTVTQGNLVLQSTTGNYNVLNVAVAANGTITHSVNWATTRLLNVTGNIAIDGLFTYTVLSHVQMSGAGTKTVRTGANASSAFSMFSLLTGTYNASGTLRVNNSFYAMYNNNAGSFHTNGQAVYANGGLYNSGGTTYVDGGSLNVTGGVFVAVSPGGAVGAVNISSGTLTADAVTIGAGALAGAVTHSGGTANIGNLLISPTGTYTCSGSPAINMSGNWTNNNTTGSFVPAGSIVTFNSTLASQAINGTVASQIFNNITVNNPGQQLAASGSTTALTLNGTMLLSAGTLVAGTASTINIGVNWTNNGATFIAGAGTVTFNGGVAQTINGSSITTFNNLTLNNANGLSLNGIDANISGGVNALTFTNGKITTGANKIILGTTGTISGAGASRYINGNLEMGVAIGSSSRVFEIGDATTYAHVSAIFNAVTVAGSVVAYTIGTEHPNITSSTINESKSVNRYWHFTNNGLTLTNYTPTFNFQPADIDAAANTANFMVGRRTTSWAYPTMGVRNPTNTTATLQSFGDYAIGEGGAAAPTMSTQPADQSLCSGLSAAFTAVATSRPYSTVQWEISTDGGLNFSTLTIASPYSVSTSNAGSATTSTLTINPVSVALDAYEYRAVFTNTRGTVTSAPAELTVLLSPTVSAGSPLANICGNGTSSPLGGTIGGSATSATWSTPSGGTFNPNATTLNATWTPPIGFTGTATLTLTSSGGPCGSVTDSKTQGVYTLPGAVTITPSSATICNGAIQLLDAGTTTTVSSGTINLAIPNNSATGVTTTQAISGIPAGATIYGINVTFNVTHGEVSELVMNLRAPNGNILNLANRPTGGNGNNFTNTVVSSSGTTLFSASSVPFTGTFAADAVNGIGATGQVSNVTAFASLYGTPNGNWVLSSRDIGASNSGTIVSWSMSIMWSAEPITWSPITGLYSNAAATTAYTAGQVLSRVYAKPATAGAHVYTATATNTNGCTSSQNVTVNAGPVVTVTADYCYGGGMIQLTAVSTPAATGYLWNTGATTQSILVDLAGLYQVTATTALGCVGGGSASIAQELIVNGDFSAGNTGFTSSYTYVNPGIVNGMYPEETYTINWNPNFNHNIFFGRDHTSNSGNLMIINGSGSNPPINVWQQTVSVQPNTDYYFSAWAISMNSVGPYANLQFDVNGAQVGTTTGALPPRPHDNNPPFNWIRFYGSWNSGAATTAVVSIVDLEQATGGNDFGLDDISFGTLSTFITYTGTPGLDSPTVCVNTPLSNITYSVGSGAAGPIVTGLPAGVTYTFNGVSLVISGTPTTVGTYNYTITTTGVCNPATAHGRIIVTEQTINRTSAAGTDAQTRCINTAITPVTYSVGGSATGASATGLPAGVTGTYSAGVFTISGTPTAAGSFSYIVTTSGPCTPVTAGGTITVQRQTITRTSAAGTNAQSVCINTAITNITYSVTGTATGAGVTGLPAGVSGSFSAGVFTISGTPTVAGVFNYTVTTTGTCAPATAAGIITVGTQTATLTSGVGTDAQSVCVNTAITTITYNIGGTATSASTTGLPAGVSESFSAGVLTISGTPTVTGVFNYTITTTGTCTFAVANGSITSNTVHTISLSSAVGTNAQSLCVNTAITNITYNTGGGATGAGVTGLPAGVTGSYNAGVFTISGTPTVTGVFNYTVTTTGACTAATANGSITVSTQTITRTSAVGTDAQTRCINTAITNITYSVGGTGTGAGVTGLPAGVTGAFNAGVFTISGTPTAAGVFNYIVTTTGTCTAATATGSITVTTQAITLTSAVGTDAQTPCINTAITNITYSVGGTGTGAGVTGLPAGVSGSFSAGVFTISGTPTASGVFNYIVTTTGTCTAATANGSITVSPASVGGNIASVSICSGASGNVTLTGNVGAILRWESSPDGTTWTNIANVTNTQSFTALTQALRFRALVQNGGCGLTVYSNTAKVGIHNLWTGATSSDWNTGTNWSDDLVPTASCPDVVIPVLTGPNVYPQLTSGTATINNLVIHTGATMVVAGAVLQVAGTITNSGILTASNGTIELNGTSGAQTIAGSIFSGNSINNLIISNSNGVSFTGTNDTVKITGLLSFGANNAVLNTNNNLTLVSNAAGTASVGDLTGGGLYSGNNVTGNATVERYIPLHPKAWQFLAVPTNGQSINAAWQEGNTPLSNALNPGYGTIITSNVAGAVGLGFDIYTPSGPTMKTYNPATDGWDGVASTSMQIANPKGYMFFVRGDRSVTVFNQAPTATTLRTTGQLFTVGADAPPSATVLPGKLESVGNPYASAIDFTLLTKPVTIDDKFYVWDPLLTNNYNGLGGYQTISLANGWKPIPGGTANYDVNTAYPTIQSGQAFFVYSTSGGGTLYFSEQAKVTGHETVNRESNLAGDRQFLRLSLYNGNTAAAALSDGNVVAFDPAFSNGLDANDAFKLTNTSENMGIKRAGKTMALEAKAPVVGSDTVFYTFSNLKRQTYQLRFSPENMDSELTALLIDKFMNTTTAVSLTGNSAVDFTITTDPLSSAADRFYLIFNRVIPAAITQIAGTHTARTTVKVDWVVAHESGIGHYEIQKSATGTSFSGINSTEAVNNNSTASYSYTDVAAGTGTNYYRIKGVKLNGQLIYSAIVKVLPQKTGPDAPRSFTQNEDKETGSASISIYPNPVVGHKINLEFANQPLGEYNIELANKIGQVVYRKSVQLNSKTGIQQLQLGENVLPGNYQLKVISQTGEMTVKQVIIQ